MKEIHSRQNEEIKAVAKLKLQKERKKRGLFIAEGFRVCKTLATTLVPHTVYCTQNMVDQAKKIASEDKITLVNTQVMEKISNAKSPSGILGIFPIPPDTPTEQLSSGIVLAQIADPGNMGTLIRTAAAMGHQSVVIIEGADPWSPKVIQSTAGTIAHVTLFQLSWEQLIKNKKALKLIALVVKDGKTPHEIDFAHTLIIVGSEAHGIPQNWIDDCEEKLTLPMPGKTESLNAAVAGSIALYLAKIN